MPTDSETEVYAIQRALLVPDVAASLRFAADQAFGRAEDGDQIWTFVREATSLDARALGVAQFDAVATQIARALEPGLADEFGPSSQRRREQSWLRRQFPRETAPPGHHPHSWHQDGALGTATAEHLNV